MIDFASALYLGFEHASWSLSGWTQLTLGKPGALEAVPGTLPLQRELASLTGCEQVVLGTSTLHLFCDLFAMLAKWNVEIWIDEATYPIARWGTDRAVVMGTPLRVFPHHDVTFLRRAMDRSEMAGRPVILTDGYCPVRGTEAPLAEYASCADARKGILVVDDTQALGVFGYRNRSSNGGSLNLYGCGGGGSLQHFGLRSPGIVTVSSLAKAFGAPLAMLGGSEEFVRRFRRESGTLVHCSPPSAAAIAAAQSALRMNRGVGDAMRDRLADLVRRFRRGVGGLCAAGGLFPVQPLRLPAEVDARDVFHRLLRRGIRCVLHRDPGGKASISFVITARHSFTEIDRAVDRLADAMSARHESFGFCGSRQRAIRAKG